MRVYPASHSEHERQSLSTLTALALALLAIGVLWRSIRYLLAFPIWGDEALLAMNFAWFDCRTLMHRLENCQIAPLLFLWGERAAYCLLGPGEFSLRLLPFLAGTGSLALYWQLTGLLLDARSRVFAVGFLAVAIWPVSMSTLIKPYSFDLFMSLLLLLQAAHWLQHPERPGRLIALALLMPVAMLGSYPAVFVGGGISLALARPAWQGNWWTRCWFAVFNLALVAGFCGAFWIGHNQLHTAYRGMTTRDEMTSYWNGTFPPPAPLGALQWFVLQTAGQMTAYPVGASNGGSILTALFCLIGVVAWARRGRWLILLAAPIFLNLLAAVIHRYPYGGSGRLSQHLAPGICILAGLGLGATICRANWPAERSARWTWAVAGLFAIIGVGGIVRDILHPYRDLGFVWMRSTMAAMREQLPVTDRVVICGSPQAQSMECVFAWYWMNEGERVTWDYQLPPDDRVGARIWGFHCGEGGDKSCRRLAENLRRQDPAWQLSKRVPYAYRPRSARDIPQQCELFCFERSPGRLAAERTNKTHAAGASSTTWNR